MTHFRSVLFVALTALVGCSAQAAPMFPKPSVPARGKPLFARDKRRSIVKQGRNDYIRPYVVLASLSDEALLSF